MERERLPVHVAVIPDGNRRWARERGGPGFAGHVKGVERFREVSRTAFEMGIRYFTFWAASVDNLTKRAPEEVAGLISLLKRELSDKKTLQMCGKNEIHFKISGEWDKILHDDRLLKLASDIDRRTLFFEKHCLTLQFGYSGKKEMLRVMQDLCYSVLEGRMLSSPDDIGEKMVGKFLGDLPPVDLLIRTGACEEGPNWSHNSAGFMMWLAADAKTFSPPTLWPDFTAEMFRQTISDYLKIFRRFGR